MHALAHECGHHGCVLVLVPGVDPGVLGTIQSGPISLFLCQLLVVQHDLLVMLR